MKIELTNEKINPFGGINFVIDEIRKTGLDRLIDRVLPERGKGAEYRYSEVFTGLWSVFFCGGDCAEDITLNIKENLENIPGLRLPGADTILRAQKELATEKEISVSKAGIMHESNINLTLNSLNIKATKTLGLLNTKEEYTFDFDNQLLPTEKQDARMSYKQKKGYFPGVCVINGMPVYIENRSGNTNVKYGQDETLTRAYQLLKEEGIKIKRSRMDCGSYSENIINVVESNCKYFYIRAMKCAGLEEQIHRITNWKTVKINHKKYEVSSIEYFPFGQTEKKYRLVIMREPNTTGEMNLFTGDAMIYRGILTNDWKWGEKRIIKFYNARGSAEKVFDMMNNDFGWNRLPFSWLQENTVYLIIMSMCRNLYKYLIEKYSKKFDFLENNFRLKKFIFRFINVGSKWIRRGRQNILKLYTAKPYRLALC